MASPEESFLWGMWAEIYLYGVYTVLFGTYMVFNIRGTPESKRSKSIGLRALDCVSVLMFVLSTSQMALQAIIDKKHLVSTPDDQHDVSQEVINRVRVARLSMGLINAWFADAVLLWRVWVLWGQRRTVVCIPFFLWILTICAYAVALARTATIATASTEYMSFDDPNFQLLAIVAGMITFVSNVVMTFLLAWKIWSFQRQMSKASTHFSKYTMILLLIVESGALYSSALIALAILIFIAPTDITIVLKVISQLTGLIPISILFLCALQRDAESRTTTTLSDWRADGPDTYGSSQGPNHLSLGTVRRMARTESQASRDYLDGLTVSEGGTVSTMSFKTNASLPPGQGGVVNQDFDVAE